MKEATFDYNTLAEIIKLESLNVGALMLEFGGLFSVWNKIEAVYNCLGINDSCT